MSQLSPLLTFSFCLVHGKIGSWHPLLTAAKLQVKKDFDILSMVDDFGQHIKSYGFPRYSLSFSEIIARYLTM